MEQAQPAQPASCSRAEGSPRPAVVATALPGDRYKLRSQRAYLHPANRRSRTAWEEAGVRYAGSCPPKSPDKFSNPPTQTHDGSPRCGDVRPLAHCAAAVMGRHGS